MHAAEAAAGTCDAPFSGATHAQVKVKIARDDNVARLWHLLDHLLQPPCPREDGAAAEK